MCPHRFRAVVGGWSVPECGGPGDVSGCRRGPGLHHGVCEAAPGDAVTGGPSPAGRSPQTASRDPPQVPAGPGARRRSSCGPELSVPTSRAEPAGWLLGFRGRCSPLLRGSPAPPTSASLGAWPGAEPLERGLVGCSPWVTKSRTRLKHLSMNNIGKNICICLYGWVPLLFI